MDRFRKLASQLGKKIPDPGAHMPHAVVGLIRRRISKKEAYRENIHIKNGSKKKSLLRDYNPFPMDFIPGSM
jgi:hypothetical protein